MTLPTRGVFAEAKLGHCNASEEIDNTRFWDWQASPIPRMASEIAPIVPVAPHSEATAVAPTAFPSPVIAVVNPPAAPDPAGLANSLKLLGTPDIFRDLSGLKETADMLKTLSDSSIKIAEAANQARGENGTGLASEPGTTGGYSNSSPSKTEAPAAHKDQSTNAASEKAQIATEQARLDLAQKSLPPSEQAEVRKAVVKKLTAAPATSATKTVVFKAKNYLNMDIEFPVNVRVFDHKDIDAASGYPRKVIDSAFTRAGSIQVKFKDAEPVIDVQIDVEPQSLAAGLLTIVVPKIRLTSDKLFAVAATQTFIQATIRQSVQHVTFEQEDVDKAGNELADKYGAELSIDKVLAVKVLAEQAKKTNVERSGRQLVKYELDLPGAAFTLSVA